MKFFMENVDRKFGLKEIYQVYLKSICGIHYDLHNGIQIIYVVKGEIIAGVGEKRKVYKEGDIVLLNRREIKFIYSRSSINLCLIINIEDKYILGLNSMYSKSTFSNSLNNIYNVYGLKQEIIYIYKASLNKIDNNKIEDSLLRLLDIILCDYLETVDHITGMEEKMEYFYDIKEITNSQDLKNISLSRISKELHLSTSYISKLFSEISFMNFSDYIQQYKLYYATIQLLAINSTIEEIALNLGFKSTKSLNRIFNKYLDISPSEYRKKYRDLQNEVEKKENAKYMLDIIDDINSRYIDRLYENREIKIHKFSIKDPVIEDLPTWGIIRNIKALGENYLDNINMMADRFDIREIILRFRIDKIGNIYLSDTDTLITNNQLYRLFTSCFEKNITPVISVKTSDVFSKDIVDKNTVKIIDSNLYQYKEFYNKISDIVGIVNMKKINYSINVGFMADCINNKEKLNIFRNYIIRQQRLLEDKMGIENYKWGYELGTIDDIRLDKLKKIYNMFREYRFKPSYVSLSYRLDNMKEIKSIDDIEDINRKIEKRFKKLKNIHEDFIYLFEKIYIRDLFIDIDITDIPKDYKDLFTVNLINQALFFSDSNYNLVLEYKMTDRNSVDKEYYPKIENEYGFITPIYWAYFLVAQMKGKVIYRKKNLIVTREDTDIYILMYGDIIRDTIFSIKNNFLNLDKYSDEIEVEIKDMEGKYKVSKITLSYEHGAVGYHIKEYDNYKYLNTIEKEYIESISVPKFDINIKEIEKTYIEKIEYSPFNCILKSYTKI